MRRALLGFIATIHLFKRRITRIARRNQYPAVPRMTTNATAIITFSMLIDLLPPKARAAALLWGT
jgi:hypothetical protein